MEGAVAGSPPVNDGGLNRRGRRITPLPVHLLRRKAPPMSRPRSLLFVLPLLLVGGLAAQIRPDEQRAYGPAAQQAAGQLLAELDGLRNHARHALAGPAREEVGRRADHGRELGLRLY